MLDPFLLKGLEKQSLHCQGLERTFWVARGSVTSASPQPIVLMLHGGGSQAEYMQALTKGRLRTLAEDNGFLLVYPQAWKNQWNDGRNAASLPAYVEGIDDVRFLNTLIAWLGEHAGGDPGRVFLGGISNGGMMSCRFALEAPGRARGIAMVAAGIPVDLTRPETSQPIASAPPVAVILIHGTADPWVPYQGGPVTIGGNTHGSVLSSQDSLRFWSRRNAGPGGDYRIREEVMTDGSGNRILRTTAEGLPPGGEVVLYTVEGGGHTWPGGWPYFTEKVIGVTSRKLDASETIFSFFKTHL